MWREASNALWLALLVVWVLAATDSKRTVRRESVKRRFVYECLFLLGFLLLFQPAWVSPLDVRFVPDSEAVHLCGLVLTASGVAFAIWARFTLGRNWSSTVTVKEDHTLVQRGPYRLVRHPIYSGILLAMLGTAIGAGRLPCLIGVAVVLVALRFKWKIEEGFMEDQFGEQYRRYEREVKAVIPGVL